LQLCANAAVTPSASKPATTIDFKLIIFHSREFNPTKHRFGYLIPWFFVRQYITIAGMAKPSPQFAGDPVLLALGAAIRRERSNRGLSQEALAVDADLDRSYMGGIERGEHNLTVMNVVKIAGALKLAPSRLFISANL
jgi:DNA-binding XRE family transcriptional regulator